MVEAEIKITASKFIPDYYYSCNFKFRNITDTKQEVTMGFPIKDTRLQDIKLPPDANNLLIPCTKDFIINMKGHIQNYTIQRVSGENEDVYCFPTSFKPNEEKQISAGYRSNINIKPEDAANTGQIDNDFITELSIPANKICYVLRTGALWAKAIGKLSINIVFEKILYELFAFKENEVSGFKQQPYSASDPDRIVLSFEKKDYEPTQDVDQEYYPADISNVLREYIKKNNFKRMATLLDYFYDSSHAYTNIKSTDDKFRQYGVIDYDTERYEDFWLANHLMYANTGKAIRYFLLAFRRIKESCFEDIDPDMLLMQPLDEWEKEADDAAPVYYIAYNLSCCYSIMNKLVLSEKWLRIAIRLEPERIRKPQDFVAYAVIIYYEAKKDSTIKVEFYEIYNVGGKKLGTGNSNIPAGRGILLIPILPVKGYTEFPYYDGTRPGGAFEFYATLKIPDEEIYINEFLK